MWVFFFPFLPFSGYFPVGTMGQCRIFLAVATLRKAHPVPSQQLQDFRKGHFLVTNHCRAMQSVFAPELGVLSEPCPSLPAQGTPVEQSFTQGLYNEHRRLHLGLFHHTVTKEPWNTIPSQQRQFLSSAGSSEILLGLQCNYPYGQSFYVYSL